MDKEANSSVIVAFCCIWLPYNWYHDGLQEVLRPFTPVVYISWHSLISSVTTPSTTLLNISPGILSIPSALLVFSFFMAALPPPSVPPTQCPPLSRTSLSHPVSDYRAILCPYFHRVFPHTPSIGFKFIYFI